MQILKTPIATIILMYCFIVFHSTESNAHSVLSNDTWMQVSVTESGVYKITYDDLEAWGFNNISSVAIFGNGAGELSLMNDSQLPDTLHEIAILIEKGNDNVFNSGDYILFYGQSPHVWSYNETDNAFSHKTHSYSDKNYYFITTTRTPTKFISAQTALSSPETATISSYDNLQVHELNETNFLNSGREFFETISSSKTISFNSDNVLTNAEADVTFAIAARHSSTAIVSIAANGSLLGTMSFSPCSGNNPYARLKIQSYTFIPSSEKTSFTIAQNYSGANSKSCLDYCMLHTRCSLKINNNEQLLFRDSYSIAENGIGKFQLTTDSQNSIWDITNPENPNNLSTQFSNGTTSFKASTENLHEYVAFSSDFKSVQFEKAIVNQDILSDTSPDMIIVANDLFFEYAEQIADLHRTIDNFSVKVVSQETICNEFSAGRKDVAAIRNYLRYVYKKGNKNLKYVLLFGDGIFTNKNIDMNGGYIFTLQSKESLNIDASYCSDDFFGILDDNLGISEKDAFSGDLSVAIGRIPVSTQTQANNYTNKLIQYATNPLYRGDWQNYLCFLADDADEGQTIHMTDADMLCKGISKDNPQFNIKKIYADAYQQVTSSAGQRYPGVNSAINDRIQKGCLIFNYTGHGNESRMMAEYAVDAKTIESWKNSTKLPFFIGAACNIAHFDYDGTSIGEKILLQKDGGGIGLISATRYSYATSNYLLCNNLYRVIFTLDSLNQIRTIGESLKMAKKNTSNDFYQNKRLYTLLGDPALRIAIPQYSIAIDSINGKNSEEFEDTIKSLSTLRIAGHVADVNNQYDSSYNGRLFIKLFDKEQSITTLGNEGGNTFIFNSYSNVLFQGLAEITNGSFSFQANIPEDILYYNGKGKLSLYATNDTIQASGAYYELVINGSEDLSDNDYTGPQVSLFLNDSSFTSGSMTNQNPQLVINVTDSSGINISNAAIGHSIVLTIDDDESNQIILNDFYYADINTYVSGSILYQLKELEEGNHTLTLSIWDAYNNVTETSIEFYVTNSSNVTISKLYNYPNPMNEITRFHFEHNQAENEVTVTIKIYDISGNLVKKIDQENTPRGFCDESLTWDGRSSDGAQMQSGIYPYTIEIQTQEGKKLYGKQKILLVK